MNVKSHTPDMHNRRTQKSQAEEKGTYGSC